MSHVATISVVVPTYNRPAELRRCVESLSEQTRLPDEVLIVDDGGLAAATREQLAALFKSTVTFDVTRTSGEPSSSTARNAGIERTTGDVVLFLDDDVVLGETYIERLLAAYDRLDDDELAGIGGFDDTDANPGTLERLYNRLFCLGTEPWRINETGMQFPIGPRKPDLEELTRADWLPGNNASFKRSVLEEHRFSHWGRGREPLEDVVFGWGLKRDGYYCLLDPSLPIDHHEADDAEGRYEFGVRHGRNRVRMFRAHGQLRYTPLFVWAMLGHVLRVFLAPVVGGSMRRYWSIATGIAVGATLESIRGTR